MRMVAVVVEWTLCYFRHGRELLKLLGNDVVDLRCSYTIPAPVSLVELGVHVLFELISPGPCHVPNVELEH